MRSLFFRLMRLTFLLVLPIAANAQSLVPSSQSSAPSAPAIDLSQPMSEDAANALLSRLSDSEVRDILLQRLAAEDAATASTEATGLNDFLFHATSGAWASVTTPVERIHDLIAGQSRAFRNFYADFGTDGLLNFLGLFGVVIGLAILVELAFRWATRTWTEMPPLAQNTKTLSSTLKVLLRRLTRDILAVIIFIFAVGFASQAIMPPKFEVYSSLIGPWLIALPRLGWAIGRFTMAKKRQRIIAARKRHLE